MRRRWWRSWPFLALLGAVLAVVAVHVVVYLLTREEPNYSRVEEGLYLGGYVAQPPPGTQAVLNLCETADPYQATVQKWEPIRDAEPPPSVAWLRRKVEFIDNQRRAGRPVFVHCRNGVSRSGMVVVAYVMFKNGWTRDEALTFVRSRRSVVRPNPAFMPLLLEWERFVKGREW
jgi:hypothetical protein